MLTWARGGRIGPGGEEKDTFADALVRVAPRSG